MLLRYVLLKSFDIMHIVYDHTAKIDSRHVDAFLDESDIVDDGSSLTLATSKNSPSVFRKRDRVEVHRHAVL